MSVEQMLQRYKPEFIQECPFCGQKQPMMIRGLWTDGNEKRLYPDMGYSFCNCKNIFYTKWANINTSNGSLNSVHYPLEDLNSLFNESESEFRCCITMKDPFFCDWTNPHTYTGFNPRENYILWDMDSFINECLNIGWEIRGTKRDMDLNSKTPECYHIHLKKP